MAGNTDYVPLDLRNLTIDLPPICDLYIYVAGQYVLYRQASMPFLLKDRERLLASGVSDLWIRVSAEGGLDSEVFASLVHLLGDPSLAGVA